MQVGMEGASAAGRPAPSTTVTCGCGATVGTLAPGERLLSKRSGQAPDEVREMTCPGCGRRARAAIARDGSRT